ncbi:MAG: hypothetical protein ABIP03_13720, partial [Aquihabitans sp.]
MVVVVVGGSGARVAGGEVGGEVIEGRVIEGRVIEGRVTEAASWSAAAGRMCIGGAACSTVAPVETTAARPRAAVTMTTTLAAPMARTTFVFLMPGLTG